MPPDGDLAHHTTASFDLAALSLASIYGLQPSSPLSRAGASVSDPAALSPIAAPAGSAQSIIVATARRIKALLDRENELEAIGPSNMTSAQDAEEQAVYDERIALSQRIVASTPTNAMEAMIVVVHSLSAINFGLFMEDCEHIVERGERAIRRAAPVLAGSLGVDLIQFGSDHFLPDYLAIHPAEDAA